MSTLLAMRGQLEAASALFERSCLHAPFVLPAQTHPDRPSILRLCSGENARPAAFRDASNGLYTRGLRSGHFELRDFLPASFANVVVGNIVGDNVLQAVEAPPFDLIINGIACPDLNPSALHVAKRFAEIHPSLAVINCPDRTLETTRWRNHQRLNALDGVVFPRTTLFRNDGDPRSTAKLLEDDGFDYPLIVREPGTQTGRTVRFVETRTELERLLSASRPGMTLYAIQYVDCRGDDGYFHKTRAFFIDGVFYPVANLTSDHWEIHSADRYRCMSDNIAMQLEEMRYLRNPPAYLGEDAFNALHSIAGVIGLDFFGIDYTIDQQGQVLVFEANAAMRHNFDHAGNFPYTRPHLERVSNAFREMVENRLAGR